MGVCRYAEVCKGYAEVHRGVCGGPCMSAQRYVEVHTGMQRGAWRCAEICGGVCRGAQRYMEGCHSS